MVSGILRVITQVLISTFMNQINQCSTVIANQSLFSKPLSPERLKHVQWTLFILQQRSLKKLEGEQALYVVEGRPDLKRPKFIGDYMKSMLTELKGNEEISKAYRWAEIEWSSFNELCRNKKKRRLKPRW